MKQVLSTHISMEINGNRVVFLRNGKEKEIKLFVPLNVAKSSVDLLTQLESVSIENDEATTALEIEGWKIDVISFKGKRYLGYCKERDPR